MAYFVGLAFVAIGALFAWAGYTHKKQSVAEEARLRAQRKDGKIGALHPSLEMLADFAPTLTMFSLGAFALMITAAFFAVNALQWLSLFDLAGMYAMVIGYGYWMYMKTRHRSVETLRALAERV
jgi:hypothetical protein